MHPNGQPTLSWGNLMSAREEPIKVSEPTIDGYKAVVVYYGLRRSPLQEFLNPSPRIPRRLGLGAMHGGKTQTQA